jgi:hypothetical protein
LSNEKPKPQPSDAPKQQSPSWYHVVASVLAAGFGVQSKKNRERDFQHGKPIVFIITGIVFTILFIFTVILVVTTVLNNAG